jgi:hypothetical protein
MDQDLQQSNSRYTAQAREVDRLQTVIQERDLTASQQETILKSDIAEREEDMHRFKAEISVLHEKLAQNGNQVWYFAAVFLLPSCFFVLCSFHNILQYTAANNTRM